MLLKTANLFFRIGLGLVSYFSILPTLAQDIPDEIRRLQLLAIESQTADWGHWGAQPKTYSAWTSHSNRLIPIYVFGGSLTEFKGEKSPYRNEDRLKAIYGRTPIKTLNPQADYFDQTDVYLLQKEAVRNGKKNIILLIFDGMDWETTQAAAIYRTGKVAYRSGRGTGLSFQDFSRAPTDFGTFVTSALHGTSDVNVDLQTVIQPEKNIGGYAANFGGEFPWSQAVNLEYLIGQTKSPKHLVTDSASSATSLCSGIKTYNSAINVDVKGHHVVPIARDLQTAGFSVGVVTNVPISHATPACAYANNVDRDDYQDLARDLLGLPSISHPNQPLDGVDVLIGCGWGETLTDGGPKQGTNCVQGNKYLTDEDLAKAQSRGEKSFILAQRTPGSSGSKVLEQTSEKAIRGGKRLLGFFGVQNGHLPFQTADGRFDPTRGASSIEAYSKDDIKENPTLAECTTAALNVLASQHSNGMWLMVEAGDVDWANHNNNLDDSIGAVFSGESAFNAIVQWVEAKSNWEETFLIVTSDHGHLLNLVQPEVIAAAGRKNLQTGAIAPTREK